MSNFDGVGQTLLAAEHKTNYFDVGKGKPLFLLHGSGPGVSGWTNWGGVMSDLAEQFRVIVPDIAGFGFTASQMSTTISSPHRIFMSGPDLFAG